MEDFVIWRDLVDWVDVVDAAVGGERACGGGREGRAAGGQHPKGTRTLRLVSLSGEFAFEGVDEGLEAGDELGLVADGGDF